MKKFICLIMLLFLVGCASTKYTPFFRGEKYPSKSKKEEIVMTTTDISKPYKRIGIVSTFGKTKSDYRMLKERVRKKAKSIGADAVIELKYEMKQNKPHCEGVAVIFTE